MKTRRAAGVLLMLALFAGDADAGTRPPSRTGSSFEANKRFGVGASLGAPFAFRAHLYLGRDTALEAGVGVYYRLHRHPLDQGGLHLHLGLLTYPAVLAKTRNFWLPFYVGAGARYLDHGAYEHLHLGVRFAAGVLVDFECAPFDIFAEAALTLDVSSLDNHSYHDTMEWSGSLGGRFYF